MANKDMANKDMASKDMATKPIEAEHFIDMAPKPIPKLKGFIDDAPQRPSPQRRRLFSASTLLQRAKPKLVGENSRWT